MKTDESDVFIQSLSHSPLSDNATDKEKECARMEALISAKLQEIMYTVDLEEVTVLQLRERLEEEFKQPLHQFRHFIDKQILRIYGQMDEASVIFEHVLLGTTFNASNRDELERRNVTHILNVTREVDNFFPGDKFEYKNIRVYDDEQSKLLPYWEETHRFINEAKILGTRCLVHCKMGISRSASTVIAYAMKENNWDLATALSFVKDRRPCIQPNPGFMKELHTYQGILEASSNRHKPIFHNDEVKSIKPGQISINNQQSNCLQSVLLNNNNNSSENEQDNNRSLSIMKVNTNSEKLEKNVHNNNTVTNTNLIIDTCLPTTKSSITNSLSLKSSTSTRTTSFATSSVVGQQSSSLSTYNDDDNDDQLTDTIIHQDSQFNAIIDLETELFAYKRSTISNITTTKLTTTPFNNDFSNNTTTTTTNNNNNNNTSKLNQLKQHSPSSLQQQQRQQENNHLLMNELSLNDNIIESSCCTSMMNRPVVLWDFDSKDDEKTKSSGVVNSIVVAKNSHCLRQWHPYVFENISGTDRCCVLNNTNKLQKAISPSSSLRTATTSLQSSTITSVSHPQQYIHQLNYASTVSSISWDYTTELEMMPSMEHAKLSIIPGQPIYVPLVTYQLVLHASIIVNEMNKDKSVASKKHIKADSLIDDECTKHSPSKLSNVLRLVSRSSESNSFITSVNQSNKEKMLSYESALIPTLKCRKNQFVCNNLNTKTTTTTTNSNTFITENVVSSNSLLSNPLLCDFMTQSTIVTTTSQYKLPNDCINQSTSNDTNDSNIKTTLNERRKSSYADLFMLKTNQNITNHSVVRLSPERSHSTRSSGGRSLSTRLRPDNSWIMNHDSCVENTVISNSSAPPPTTTTANTTTTHSTIMNSCSLVTSTPTLCSKINRILNTLNQSVISSNSIDTSLSSNNNENIKNKTDQLPIKCSKSYNRIICNSVVEKFKSNSSMESCLTVNKLTMKTTPTSITTTDSCSDEYNNRSKFLSNSSNPMLIMSNSVGVTPGSDYYHNKNSNYQPITTTYRPLRHLINNWPPHHPIDPIQATESYCS
ncbi:unnamed protein product [Schistosoma turkestanicum]|nr:unnamed protein product [Schistosoma turkestanicum]